MLVERARTIPGMDHRLGRASLNGWPVWQRDPEHDYRRCISVLELAASREGVRAIAEAAGMDMRPHVNPIRLMVFFRRTHESGSRGDVGHSTAGARLGERRIHLQQAGVAFPLLTGEWLGRSRRWCSAGGP